MMENLGVYNALRAVPESAKKEIKGGRLRGMTDINPVWRIKALTEQFGPCGIGWKYEITSKEQREAAGGEIAAFVDVALYIKVDGAWSDAIPGTGGSMFVAKETGGLRASDECYKMALTDAISVACKALGVGADVYWEKDKTKYNVPEQRPPIHCQDCKHPIAPIKSNGEVISPEAVAERTRKAYGKTLCFECAKRLAEAAP